MLPTKDSSHIIFCENCGDQIRWPGPAMIARGCGRFCSRACQYEQQAKKFAERFWSLLDRSGGPDACWEWQGGPAGPVYGQCRFEGRKQQTHRIAWQIANGPIPDGLKACHTCDNRRCCNPSHLFLGTNADNSADMAAKDRSNAENRKSTKLSKADVLLIRSRHGDAQRAIAEEFGVSQSHISRIMTGDVWSRAKG